METNYRVYAYTTSAVEMEILRLFTRPDYRLPNLYVGMLTRESVHQALGSGCGPRPGPAFIRSIPPTSPLCISVSLIFQV